MYLCVCVCLYIADLSAVDNLQSTSWDYATARRLHYSMLIIASYFRQRSCGSSGSSVDNGTGNVVLYESFDEGLGISSLQV